MYLMNVPPVAAIYTEWRSCGPPRGFSLPLCFNDSDSDLSTTGTPIPDKVQMIIESLRSTQSSLDMGDEIEGNMPSGQEARPLGYKALRGPMAAALKTKCRGPSQDLVPEVSSPMDSDSQESDSDDSVDRGIEEAIQEYLKEKDDHKRKAEPAINILQPSKIPRKDQTFADIPKQHSDSNKVLTASNQVPRSVKVEAHTTTMPAMKKLTLQKIPYKENPFKKMDTSKGEVIKNLTSSELKRGPSNLNPVSDRVMYPKTVKVEEDSPDSSSDDGIEEAIQRYQLEKKKEKPEEGCTESSKPQLLKEDSDSSSDDGIEEAIRSYQLEKQKEENSVVIQSLPKQKQMSKVASESTSSQLIKKHKLSRKKKKKTERDLKSPLPTPSPSCVIKKRLTGSPKGKGNEVLSSKVETLREQHTPATLKVNTTVELMCAEAILDISKAVLPKVFNPNAGPTSSNSIESTPLLISSNCPGDKSDDSSIDSEDGIEQEIRMFLEQKAQMHKQLPDTATGTACPGGVNETEREKTKLSPSQKKTMRLSLKRKRKCKEEGSRSVSKGERTVPRIDEEATSKLLTETERGSSSSVSCQRNSPQSVADLEREQSGDKSSSLDSNEDLDTAIKDLLKTKKKLKKKTRDMKLKSRKGLKDLEPLSVNKLQLKKLRTEPRPKPSLLKSLKVTTTHSKNDNKEKRKVSKLPQSNKRKESIDQAGETDTSKGNACMETLPGNKSEVVVQVKEDSSSVDSDDSIELEIRKFLAEKAKVSTVVKTRDGEEMENGNVKTTGPLSEKDIGLEDQLAEIPITGITQLSDPSLLSRSEQRACQDGRVCPNKFTVLPDNLNSTTVAVRGPCFSSAVIHSSCPLEPADGAGAAKAEKRGRDSVGSCGAQNEIVRGRSLPSPILLLSGTDSEQRHERQAIAPTGAKDMIPNKTPFHTSAPSVCEVTATTPVGQCGVANAHQRRSADRAPDTPNNVSSAVRSFRSIVPFHRSSEMPVSATSRSPFPSLTTPRRPAGRYFMQSHASLGRWGQSPNPGLSESVVHVAKDQTMFVELSTNKTNHVQVKSRELSKGEEKRDLPGEMENERENKKTDERGEQIGGREEECVDETDCESGKRRSPEKKQGFPTFHRSLSSAIDSGVTLSPYIALNSEERRRRFKGVHISVKHPKGTKTEKPVKRKLQFHQMSRTKEPTWK